MDNNQLVLILNEFKEYKINKTTLLERVGNDLKKIKLIKPVLIKNSDLIQILNKLKSGIINQIELIEWVNTIWFSGLYEYSDGEDNSIASVMNYLEELDETRNILSEEEINRYIVALEKNVEV